MFTRTRIVAALAVATIGGITFAQAASSVATASTKSSKSSKAKPNSADQAELERLRVLALALSKDNAEIQANLKTFDALDFDIFSNQKWDQLKESHAQNVKVVWPDGHFTVGIDKHIEDLKALFVHAPDTRIKEHPVAFGTKNMTIVEGVFEGTFTKPMPDGKGGFIQPTGKAFKMPMATIGFWKDGTMYEEHLFWDNQTYGKQIGLG